jgi:Cellulase (glycosyl hydrolase family 5)
MRRRPLKAVVAVALALLGLAVLAATGGARTKGTRTKSTPAATTLLGGINIDGLDGQSSLAEAEHQIALAVQLHAKVIRVELPWSVLEPNGPGQLNASAVAYADRLMSDAVAHRIGVIALVDRTPCWASSAPAELIRECTPTSSSKAFDYPPSNPADFAAFARLLVERYGNAMTAFEVWNEPDQANEKYFAGPNKAERYAALLAAAYPAIKQANPRVKVLAGSLVGSNGVFLRLLYKAGIKGHYDGLAVHFYTLSLEAVREIRAVQLANGDNTPLWLDEFGWPDCYPRLQIQEEQACVTPAVQAQNITNLFRALSRASYVAAATLYELQDSSSESFGVLTDTGVRKPAFKALAGVLASPSGAPSPVTLTLRASRGRIVASGSGPVGDAMQLEAFQGRVLRFRATFTLDRFNRYTLTLPALLGTRNVRVRVFQQWSGIASATQRRI